MKTILYIAVVLLAISTGILLDTIFSAEGNERRKYVKEYMPCMVMNVFMLIADGIILLKP